MVVRSTSANHQVFTVWVGTSTTERMWASIVGIRQTRLYAYAMAYAIDQNMSLDLIDDETPFTTVSIRNDSNETVWFHTQGA